MSRGVGAQVLRGVRAAVVLVLVLTLGVVAVRVLPLVGSSTPYARVLGDPSMRLAPGVAFPTVATAPVYRIDAPLRARDLTSAMGGGRTVRSDGWLQWHGSSATRPAAVLRRLLPATSWTSQRLSGVTYASPAGGTGVRVSGPLTAFNGTPVVSNAFAMFSHKGSRVVWVSLPGHTVMRTGSVRVVDPARAFDDLRHHRPKAFPLSGSGEITSIYLANAADPTDPTRSVPAWVFGDAGQVLAAR